MSSAVDRLKAAADRDAKAWFEQDNWCAEANKDLMRAIIALDAQAARKSLADGAQLDFIPPTSNTAQRHFGSPLGVAHGSPWLGYTLAASQYDAHCEHPDRVGVIAALLEQGADPLAVLPGDDGDVFILNAMMDHASPELVATLSQFEPRLSATWPVSNIGDGAGPLAHALLSRYEIPVFGDDPPHGARPHLDRENAVAELLKLGSRWDEFTRGAALAAAAGSSSVAALELLGKHGCKVDDMTTAERTAVQDTIDLISRVYPDQQGRWAEWIQVVTPELASPTYRRRASP